MNDVVVNFYNITYLYYEFLLECRYEVVVVIIVEIIIFLQFQ